MSGHLHRTDEQLLSGNPCCPSKANGQRTFSGQVHTGFCAVDSLEEDRIATSSQSHAPQPWPRPVDSARNPLLDSCKGPAQSSPKSPVPTTTALSSALRDVLSTRPPLQRCSWLLTSPAPPRRRKTALTTISTCFSNSFQWRKCQGPCILALHMVASLLTTTP